MDTRYLKSLLSVVDTGSIAEAARVEGLTAAAIGQRIQALERQLGVPLLSRARHTARPTEACLNLVPRARHIVREASRLAADIDPAGLRGTLRVGAISTALTGMMPATLRTLTVQAPEIKPVIVPGTSRELYEGVADGSLDAALLVVPPFVLPKTLAATPLRDEPLMLVTPLQGPYCLDEAQAAMPGRLETLPYIRYDPQAWGGRHAAQWLDDQGIAPPVVCDLDALETIVMLVSDGVGISLLPAWDGIARLAQGCRLTPLTPLTSPTTPAPRSLVHEDADSAADGTASNARASNATARDRRYARRIVLLHAAQPDRPRMLAALAHALTAGQRTAPMPGEAVP